MLDHTVPGILQTDKSLTPCKGEATAVVLLDPSVSVSAGQDWHGEAGGSLSFSSESSL